ncbi:MAG TPA: hypothetical protein VFO95_10005 [Gemmatimonadales bacterium]|nr:hypothetical protein [Gemmatimonadales bacterium]
MHVSDAQQEVRTVFRGGSVGQLVSGLLWLGSAALATWSTPRNAIVFLVIGGFFIFPLTQLGLKLLGGPASLSRDNPLGALGMQVAFTLPLSLPVVGAVAIHHLDWFYPAFLVVLGAHYLPFVFLYGMRLFAGLSFGLVSLGIILAHRPGTAFGTPAWLTGVALIVFAAVGHIVSRKPSAVSREP